MNVNTKKQISIQGLEEAVKVKQPIRLQVIIDNSLGYINHLVVLFNKYGQQMGEEFQATLHYDKENSNSEYSCFATTIQFQTPGYRTYVFKITVNGKQYFIKHDSQEEPVITKGDYPFFETFAYDETFSTPDWAKGAIMYQIYVDTFCCINAPPQVAHKLSAWGTEPKWLPDDDGEYRNNRFTGGNLQGIIAMLPYLKKLGVTILYLTPIFKSPSSNRYDIEDYEQIDEMVGDWPTMKVLHDAAHENGMHTVLDGVFNHCNPNNELYVKHRHLFTGNCWWGYKHLVEFDVNSEEYQRLLKKILNLYLQFCDGIRLDVADNLSASTLRLIRTEIKEIEKKLGRQIYLLGEVWKNAIKGDRRSFLYGNELDAVMNYQFSDSIYRYIRWGDFNEFKRKIFDDVLRLYPKCVIDVLMNPLSTHDIPRIPNILTNPLMVKETYMDGHGNVFIWDYDKLPCWTRNGVYQTHEKRCWEHEASNLSEDEKITAYRLQKPAVVMQYTLPGIPSIFAGDELGVSGLKDPFNRTCMPWDKVAGNELKDFYIRIGELRTRYREIFAEGKCELVLLDEKVCIYKRTNGKKSIYCAFNRTGERIELNVKLVGNIIFSLNESTLEVLNPYEAILIEC